LQLCELTPQVRKGGLAPPASNEGQAVGKPPVLAVNQWGLNSLFKEIMYWVIW